MDTNLKELFIDQLQDMYDAEIRLVAAIPAKIDAADDATLKSDLKGHLAETENHVTRLQEAFKSIDVEAKRNTCEATKGLVAEAEELLDSFKGTPAVDAAVICAAQKVEHYEIATYGCLVAWAEELGFETAAALLQQNLDEEKIANEKLTNAATMKANFVANV